MPLRLFSPGPNASDGDDLRCEVESLLESPEAAGDFIEWPAADVATALLAEHDSGLKPGQVVGRYKIIRLLAEGGMGQVYLARDTTQLARPAAIKVLPPELASDRERMGLGLAPN